MDQCVSRRTRSVNTSGGPPVTARTPRRLLAALALATAVLSVPGVAQAKGGGDDTGTVEDGGGGAAVTGDFAVTVNGRTANPAAGKDYRLDGVAPTSPVVVTGRHVGFRIDPATLGVYDYTLTAAVDAQRMATAPTVVFASKLPVLTPAQLSGVRISELRLRDDNLVVSFSTAAGKFKVQAKDAPQGGIFQMEQEFGVPVEFVHTLGTGLFYFVNEFTGKWTFGNGVDADATHRMLLGKDSPQVATKLLQTATVTRWSVASGGRMCGVPGAGTIET